jgi:hypothetical protein
VKISSHNGKGEVGVPSKCAIVGGKAGKEQAREEMEGMLYRGSVV